MWAVALVLTVGLLPCVTPQADDAVYNSPYNTEKTPLVWHVNEYPGDPWWFHAECNRANHSAVCDPNGIVTKEQANEIDRVVESVAVSTRCPCYNCVNSKRGYIIRIALMEQMASILHEDDEIIDRLRNAKVFAYLLSNRWRLIGRCNETVLIVYSRIDNVLFTLTGQRAREKLDEGKVVEISMDVRPFFTDKKTVAEGLITMIRKYRDVFNNKYERNTGGSGISTDGDGGGGASLPTWSPVMILLPLAILFHS